MFKTDNNAGIWEKFRELIEEKNERAPCPEDGAAPDKHSRCYPSPITDLLRVSSPQETKLIWTNHEKSTRGLVLTEEYPLTMLDVGFYCGMPISKDHFKSIQLGSNGRDSQDL